MGKKNCRPENSSEAWLRSHHPKEYAMLSASDRKKLISIMRRSGLYR